MTAGANKGSGDFYNQLHQALGNIQALKQRECRRLIDSDIHCELYRAESLAAPLIVFFPGLGTYVELYAQLLASLADQGFNIVGIDPPGHGYSSGPSGAYQPEDIQRITSQVLDELETEFPGPKVTFGHSIGAMLAVAAAEHDSRVKAVVCQTLLVTEMPPDCWHFLGWQWTWGSALWLPEWRVPLQSVLDYRQLISGHPAAELLQNDPLLVMAYPLRTLSGLFQHKAGVMRASYPFDMLLIQGEADSVLSLSYAQRVREQAVHNMEMRTIPYEGHMLPLQSPLKLTGIVAEWLRKAL